MVEHASPGAARARPGLGGVLRPPHRGRPGRLRPAPTYRAARPPRPSPSPAPRPAHRSWCDMCCGSGAIGAALAAAAGRVELHAVDIDPAAVRLRATERRRRPWPGLRGRSLRAVARIVARTGRRAGRERAVRPHGRDRADATRGASARAAAAFDGGADGLDVQRRVRRGGGRLAPGGHLLIETSERQAPPAAETLTWGGLIARVDAATSWKPPRSGRGPRRG